MNGDEIYLKCHFEKQHNKDIFRSPTLVDERSGESRTENHGVIFLF